MKRISFIVYNLDMVANLNKDELSVLFFVATTVLGGGAFVSN